MEALRAERFQRPYYGLPSLPYAPPTAPSSEVDRLRLLDRRRSLQSEILSIDAVLNSGVPVNLLPPEILIEIALFIRADNQSPHIWLPLLLVCRYWFSVLSLAPRLWSRLACTSDIKFFRMGLARSKAVPLSLSVEHSAVASEAVDLILPHAHRIHTLNLSAEGSNVHLFTRLAQCDMHALRTLSFEYRIIDPDHETEPTLEVNQGQFPTYRSHT